MNRQIRVFALALFAFPLRAQVDCGDLASFLEEQHRYADARLLYFQALSFGEAALTLLEKAKSPKIAEILEDLATLYYRHLGRVAQAQACWRRAIAVREAEFGPEHLSVAVPLMNLANTYQGEHRLEESERLYRRALAIQEKSLDSGDARIGVTLNSLGDVSAALGRPVEAERLLRRAESILKVSTGMGQISYSFTIMSLGQLRMWQGDYAEAELLYRRTLALREQWQGGGHPDVVEALICLGELEHRRGNSTAAESYFRRAVTIADGMRGRDHADNWFFRLKHLPRLHTCDKDLSGKLDFEPFAYSLERLEIKEHRMSLRANRRSTFGSTETRFASTPHARPHSSGGRARMGMVASLSGPPR
jgi:tetratricopeptide (TPR) repeat protein